MATIVTMDSNGSSVLSPAKRTYSDSEPELVNGQFYLDGTQPLKGGAEGEIPGDESPQKDTSRMNGDQRRVEVVIDKPMSTEERARLSSSGTGTTATISDSDSFVTSERTNSSSTAKSEDMSSPMANATKTNLPANDTSESPHYNMQMSDRRVSNISFQDMHDGDDDEDVFYSDQQTPPTSRSQKGEAATTTTATPTDGRPPPLRASDCKGTPPTTLYALPEHASNPYNNALQRSSVEDPPVPPVFSPADESVASSNTSYNAAPAFPPDGNTPQNSVPHRPMLYSAIGSLETCGAHSLKKMWTKPKQKGFVKFDSTQLIAPKTNKQQEKNNSKAGCRNAKFDGLSTQDRFGDSTSGEAGNKVSPAGSNGSSQPTPTTSHHQAAFNSSLKEVQQKIEAVQQTKGIKSSSNYRAPAPSSAEPATAFNASNSAGVTKRDGTKIASSMRKSKGGRNSGSRKSNKSVKIDDASLNQKKRSKKPVEMFRPSCDAYTPRMERKKIAYKPAEMRTPVQKMATTMGTLSRPNFRDALRRVAMLLRQHIVKIEQRFNSVRPMDDEGLFKRSMKDAFSEENFASPRYKCAVVRVPMARPGMIFGLKKIRPNYEIPSEEEIYEFAHQLFKTVQLSSECSIVCLIYIERLMEVSKVPLLSNTWKPIFMCGLLLASKVWQDLSSWNIEFASVYPQFSLDSINKLELQFLRMVKWDLYISSSLYAKYYFALRSLVEKPDFRQRYNRMVGGVDSVAASEALKIQKRTEQVKEEALMQLSRSM